MRLSAKAEYGVRAMAVLAYHYTKEPLSLRGIAFKEGISLKFLEQFFPDLRRAGLVNSFRGARGGYTLAQPPGEIRVGDIIRAVDGPITPVDCLDEGKRGSRCHHHEGCLTRQVWEKLRDRINDVLDEVTLDELIKMEPLCSEE